jgi:hypothetical protein
VLHIKTGLLELIPSPDPYVVDMRVLLLFLNLMHFKLINFNIYVIQGTKESSNLFITYRAQRFVTTKNDIITVHTLPEGLLVK